MLRPVVRFSYARDAYILRIVGRHVGPVYQLRNNAEQGMPAGEK